MGLGAENEYVLAQACLSPSVTRACPTQHYVIWNNGMVFGYVKRTPHKTCRPWRGDTTPHRGTVDPLAFPAFIARARRPTDPDRINIRAFQTLWALLYETRCNGVVDCYLHRSIDIPSVCTPLPQRVNTMNLLSISGVTAGFNTNVGAWERIYEVEQETGAK